MAPDDPEIYFLVHGYYNFQIRKIRMLQINLTEVVNKLKFPLHMDCLVLFESSCYCKASSQVPPTMDSTSALEL